MNLEKCDIEKNVVSLYPDIAVFSEFILNFYKDYKIADTLVKYRGDVKIDPNSFLVEGRSKFMKKNYPDIKLNYIDNDLLPDYSIFYAKDVEYFVFSKKEKKGLNIYIFIFICLVLIVIGILLIRKRRN